MEQLKRMAVFAMVVDQGSMVGAAQKLGMTASAVSQQIRKLEQITQVSLLHRTTRKLTLTEAGAQFYRSCAQVVELSRQAEQRLAELRDAPVGELRIAAPEGFSGRPITDALVPLLQAHSGLSLKLFFHDEWIDLLDHRIDLAIRVGHLEDSSLVARHIGDGAMVICAAPAYLARIPPVSHPDHLAELDWLVQHNDRMPTALSLHGPDGEVHKLKVQGRISANNLLALRNFTLAGMGVSLQPIAEIRDELTHGRLLRLLPEWQAPSIGIYIVTPRRDVQPAKVRYAIEALRQNLFSH